MRIISASQTVNRREERLAIQARLEDMDRKLSHLVKEVGAVVPSRRTSKRWAKPSWMVVFVCPDTSP
jgi:hypothetical protein